MEINDFLSLVRFKNTTIMVFYILIFSILMTRNFIIQDFLLILIVNLLAVWSIYSFNDSEDAEMEMSFKKGRKFFHKNIILSGRVTKSGALTTTMVLAISALLLSMSIGNLNLVLTASILLLGFLYSNRNFRLKSKPPLDVLSHALIGPLIPLGIFINVGIGIIHVMILISLFLGAIIPELLNQRYDYNLDKKNKIRTTVQLLGKSFSLKLIIMLAFAIIILNGIIFLLYGGMNLASIYILLSPLLMMFLFKRVRQWIEKKPAILAIPVVVNLLVLLLGFFNLV